MNSSGILDVIVIGGGQAGLAVGFYLRRTALSWVILDAQDGPGGAWRHGWESLQLFSPAKWSSLPGWLMPGGEDAYPARPDVLGYLAEYERRYALRIERPVRVHAVHAGADAFTLQTAAGFRRARAVVSATGTWEAPFLPDVEGRDAYRGTQLHSAHYRSPRPFAGTRVLVIGGGNSGAQIFAEVSRVAMATWVALEPPRFLADDVDGRVLFDGATARWRARQAGLPEPEPVGGLGDIVMVAPVREARDRGVLHTVRPFVRMTESGVEWPDGREERIDAIIWCTGFRPALAHLAPLRLEDETGRIAVRGTRSVAEPRLWLVGYGDWTGYASATLIAVGRTARATVEEIVAELT